MKHRHAPPPARLLPAVLPCGIALLLTGCGRRDATHTGDTSWPVAADASRDIRRTDLRFNLAARTAQAELLFSASATPCASLEVGDLHIQSTQVAGRPIACQQLGAGAGSTLIWPQACGPLFPCHSAPADGSLFLLAPDGVPAGQVAVYAPRIDSPAPAYQLA